MNKNLNIGIVGLGYVGFPLFKKLSRFYNVYGIDADKNLIKKLSINKKIKDKIFDNFSKVSDCSIIIVTVPTPVLNNKPDLSNIYDAYKNIAINLSKNSTIILESTVYPGVTESYCVPIIEKYSNLKWKKGFNVGYSPERVSPGESDKTIDKITKVISGDCKKTTDLMVNIYSKITKKYYIASCIKVAEASKLIENTQRDANIALMNEFKKVFNSANINIYEVLAAAKTKWNFIDLVPGLVGGHCIGVDPYYYLDFLAKNKHDVKKSLVEQARNTNESMVEYYYKSIIKKISAYKVSNKPKILILGITFKKNIDDVRNSKAIEIAKKLINKYKNIHIYDPYVDIENIFGIEKIYLKDKKTQYDVIINLVNHDLFNEFPKFNKNELKISIEPVSGYVTL